MDAELQLVHRYAVERRDGEWFDPADERGAEPFLQRDSICNINYSDRTWTISGAFYTGA